MNVSKKELDVSNISHELLGRNDVFLSLSVVTVCRTDSTV